MKPLRLALTLPAAALLAYALLATGGTKDAEACGGNPCPTPTPVATSTPVVQTIVLQQSQSQIQMQQQVQYASNWIVTQTCAGTIQHNTATGAQHRIDTKPAPGCESRSQPSRAVPTADNRAYVGSASFTTTTTTTTNNAPVRIAPPRSGDGGLK